MFDGGNNYPDRVAHPLLRLHRARPAGPSVDPYPSFEVQLVRLCLGRTGTPCGAWCDTARVVLRPHAGKDDAEICLSRGCCGSSNKFIRLRCVYHTEVSR